MSASEIKLQPGMVLAERYQLSEEIGRGGFGMVYRARQLNMDRDVALKILPPKFMAISDVVERFRREARLASRLRHPNTITVHDYGSHENLLFIVMELLEGEDLADVLAKQRTLEMERILHIGRQTLKSLHEAHTQNIVHRDLKPENIFLAHVGEERDFVKVLDFGIAKLAMPEAHGISAGRKLTLSGSTVGTPTYMSPEQAAGDEVDPLSDLYALAIILYETACGKPPFHDESAARVMRAHLFTAVPKFAHPPLRDSRFEAVLLKALSKEKQDRYPSAQAFLQALSPSAAEMLSPAHLAEDPPTTEFFGLEGRGDAVDSAPGRQGVSSSPDFRASSTHNEAVRPKRTTESMLRALEMSLDADDETAIPFDSVPQHSARARVQADARQEASGSGSNRISQFDEAGFVEFPPPGLTSTPTSSSIITVLEPDAEEVILLTQKKVETPTASAVATEGFQPEPRPPAPAKPERFQPEPRPPARARLESPADRGAPPSKSPARQTFSGELNGPDPSSAGPEDSNWAWQAEQPGVPPPEVLARLQPSRSRKLVYGGVALILVILLIAGLQASGIIKLF